MVVTEKAVFGTTFSGVFGEIEKALEPLFYRRFSEFLTLISCDL